MNKRSLTPIYLITFFAGFASLVYEISWNRYLSLILGDTVAASTIVLMAFMAGFGLGAFFLGRYANRITHPGRLLSMELIAIGVLSFINYHIIGRVAESMYGSFSSLQGGDLFFFTTAFILLFIPAFFMGGIFPLVNRIVITEDKTMARRLGAVFALETTGSTLGGLIAGFVLLGTLGQDLTMYTAIVINLLIAGYVFFSGKYITAPVVKNNQVKKHKNASANSEHSPKLAKLATFFAGFTLLALQVIWMRIFKTYFTNTSYTFALITSFVILGLSFGGWLYRKNGAKIKNNDRVMLKLIVLLSLFALVGLFFLYKFPELFMFPFADIMGNQIIRLLILPAFASVIIVLPAAMTSGYTFPLACNMYSRGAKNISTNVGYILMVNTAGAVTGPAIATFLLIPVLGTGKAILFAAMILTVLALYGVYRMKPLRNVRTYQLLLSSKLLILLLAVVFSKEIRFMPPSVKKMNKQVLEYKETVEGTIVVVENKNKGLFGKSTFVNNSAVIGSNYDAIKAVKMVGHIPLLSSRNCEDVLVIGFGIGVSTSAIAEHNEVDNIDCVELVPGLVETANHYSRFNQKVYKDDRLQMIPGDGRHYLQMTSKKYDLISCDPTHPVLGSGNLYTKEYFSQVHDRLKPEGMVSQYLPLHKLRLQDLQGIIKTFHSVFPNASVWLGQYHAILIGQKGNGKIDFQRWKREVNQLPKDDFFYLNPYHIAANVVLDSKKIQEFPDDIPINTDNLNYTEFFSFDSFDSENIYQNLKYLANHRCEIDDVFKGIDNPRKMKRYKAGNIRLTKSLYHMLRKERRQAFTELKKATRVNPENQEYPFLIKFYYGQ
jgi:predicted membrane-bound spermidine synthase